MELVGSSFNLVSSHKPVNCQSGTALLGEMLGVKKNFAGTETCQITPHDLLPKPPARKSKRKRHPGKSKEDQRQYPLPHEALAATIAFALGVQLSHPGALM